MNTLLVGAGAVGCVLGHHLQRGGARVSFFVRPEHVAATRPGFTLYPLHRRDGRSRPVELTDFDLLTSMDEVAARRWDCVILCVSSPALRRGRWLEELARASGDATVVAIQPGLDDPAYLDARVAPERMVWGMFGLISFSTDAVGETVPRPGLAYWRPPLSKLPFSGAAPRTRALVEALNRGGLPSRVHPDVPREMAFGGALLDLHMQALECAHWRFAELRGSDELLATTHAALREALEIAGRYRSTRAPWPLRHLGPWLTRLALRLLPRLAPFDIETYFRVHFTKVGEQSAQWLRTYIALAEGMRLPCDSLRRMQALVDERRAAPAFKEAPHVHPVQRGNAQAN